MLLGDRIFPIRGPKLVEDAYIPQGWESRPEFCTTEVVLALSADFSRMMAGMNEAKDGIGSVCEGGT